MSEQYQININSQLPEGVAIENFGGITTLWLYDDLWQERLYEYVGRYEYVATYTLKQGSESFRQFGDFFTATIVYTKKERESLEQSYLSGSKIYGKVRLNETNYQLSEDKKTKLKEEGIQITDIESVCALPMPRENLYVKDSIRKLHRLEIPLPQTITSQDTIEMLQQLYEDCIRANRELCPHERNQYYAVKLLFYSSALTDEDKQKIYDECGNLNDEVEFERLRIKNEINEPLSQTEQDSLNALVKKESEKRIFLLKRALSDAGVNSITNLRKTQPDLIKNLLLIIGSFHPIRLNTLAHRHAIYLDLKGYLHILLRHVSETSVDSQPIKEKSKMLWNFEDLMCALKGVVDIIADEYDVKRDNQTGRIYWTGDKAIEFGGDYYTLQISPNGRIDTWYRMKNNILGK